MAGSGSARRAAALAGPAAVLVLLAATPAGAEVEPSNLRWQILPGAGAGGVPVPEQTAPAGPIFDTVTNQTVPGLLHTGTARVEYGAATAQSQTVVDAALLPIGGGFCFPAPCGGTTAEWSDTVTITAPGIADGSVGSFTAQILTLGILDAFVPNDWHTYAGTFVNARYAIFVSIEDELRDQLSPSCVAIPDEPCSVAGQSRLYRPEDYPTSPQVVTPLPSLSPVLPLGPYDFRFGEPFELQVTSNASSSVARAGNQTGEPQARVVLFFSWGGLVSVHDAGGGLGNEVPIASLSVTEGSGVDWVAAPEPAGPALAAAALVALVALRRLQGVARESASSESTGMRATRMSLRRNIPSSHGKSRSIRLV